MSLVYRGRFAPSPTGLLHLGSLFTATASYLDAKHHQGIWLVRMEDLDPPREMPGAASAILKTLEDFGLEWDESVIYQSHRHDQYQAILEQLLNERQAYYCTCSRKLIQTQHAGRYPGTCRNCFIPPSQPAAIRLRLPNPLAGFLDEVQGEFQFPVDHSPDDCVLRRRDGLYAYHLAVVADDHAQQINTIVRGQDLLDSTPIHLQLQHLLHYPTPHYAHLPLLVNAQGQKLSKQNLAQPVDSKNAAQLLWTVLDLLGQQPPQDLCGAAPTTLLSWAIPRWRRQAIAHHPLFTHQ